MSGLKKSMKMAASNPSPFRCKIKNLDTFLWVLMDDKHPEWQQSLQICEGVTISSENRNNILIHIAENVTATKPIQIVSAIQTTQPLKLTRQIKVVLEKNASLTLLHCDDSLDKERTDIHNFVEITLAENARLDYYKMENKDAGSVLTNKIEVQQNRYSQFYSNVITFNAGNVNNFLHVNLNEPFADAQLNGLYLVDNKQRICNEVKVFHNAPDCTSRQLYKGIVDDEATAVFNGHIVVQKDAQRTAAYQINKNIALTDEAHIQTQPFLEIYADDVKCSHGATVGQLDENAMFYLRSRGICQKNARMLLMFAFANEVAQTVKIQSLSERLSQMIQQRLRGELHICSQCALHCEQGREISFG
ncbi:MAG: Fe-S cluster assembly protein SufD [Bacteroidales bacterium]|jgi:Fe-S cluster assembly protein SufD|nr:Fe-S cluster assembly protein SufD [Bacteroidales bacterium]